MRRTSRLTLYKLLTNGPACVGVFAADQFLDGVQLGNTLDHLVTDRRRGVLRELDEAASPVRPAIRSRPRSLRLLRIGDDIVDRVAINHQRAASKPLEEFPGDLAAACPGMLEHHDGRVGAAQPR